MALAVAEALSPSKPKQNLVVLDKVYWCRGRQININHNVVLGGRRKGGSNMPASAK